MGRDAVDGLSQHKTDQCDDVQVGKCLRWTLVIAHQTPKACCPGEGPLNHPAPGQQHEAAFGLRQFNNLQLDAMLAGRGCRFLACIVLIAIGQLDTLAGGQLHGLRQLSHLSAIIHRGGGDMGGQKVTEHVHRHV